jgi:hypothetical protein
MFDTTLNNQEKYQVISQLEKQGFNDPYIVTEMLNRLESDVVLRMKADNSLSLENALEDAMKDTHKDFRLPGNYPIVAYYKVLIKKKYKALYKRELKKTITNPVYIISSLLLALITFKGYSRANTNFKLWDINGVTLTLFILWLLLSILLTMKFSIRKRPSEAFSAIVNEDYWLFFIVFVIIPMNATTSRVEWFASTLCAVGAFYLIITSVAKYAALSKARNDISLYLSKNRINPI